MSLRLSVHVLLTQRIFPPACILPVLRQMRPEGFVLPYPSINQVSHGPVRSSPSYFTKSPALTRVCSALLTTGISTILPSAETLTAFRGFLRRRHDLEGLLYFLLRRVEDIMYDRYLVWMDDALSFKTRRLMNSVSLHSPASSVTLGKTVSIGSFRPPWPQQACGGPSQVRSLRSSGWS